MAVMASNTCVPTQAAVPLQIHVIIPSFSGSLTRAAIILHKDGTIVIMEACKLSSRQRVATTAYAALPARGIVG
jgi:hypothetical protein